MVEEHEGPQPENVDWSNIAKEEALWFIQTMAMIALSLAIGRILTLLTQHGGVDLNLTQGDWQRVVDKALADREGPKNGTMH